MLPQTIATDKLDFMAQCEKNGPPSLKSEPGDFLYANYLCFSSFHISSITHSKHYPLLLTVFESPFNCNSYHCLYKPIHILELVLKPVY